MGTIESSTYYSQTTVDTSSTIPNNTSLSQSSPKGVESNTIRIPDNNQIVVEDTNKKKTELQEFKNSTSTNNDDDIIRLSSRKNIRTLKGVVYGDSNVGKSLLIRRLRGESVFHDCCFDSDKITNTNHEKAQISSSKRKFMALIPWKYHQQTHFTSQQRQLLLLDSSSNDDIAMMINTDDIIQLHITEASSSSNPPTPKSLWNYSSSPPHKNFNNNNNPDFMIFLIDPRRRSTLDYVMTCLENIVLESNSEGTNEQPTQRDEDDFTPTLSICIFLNFFDIVRVPQHLNDFSQKYSNDTSTTNTTTTANNNPQSNISETKTKDYITIPEIQSRINSFQSQLPNHRLGNINKSNHTDTQSNTQQTKYNTLLRTIPNLQFQVFDSSMKNGYGLQQLNTFMVLPYLQSKRNDMYRYMMRLQMGYDRWSTALLQNIHHNENSRTSNTCCETTDGTSSSTPKHQHEKDSKCTTYIDSISKDTESTTTTPSSKHNDCNIILPPIMTYEELDRLHHLQLSIRSKKQRSILVNQNDIPQSADSQNNSSEESTYNNNSKLKSSSIQHEQSKPNDNRRTIFPNDLISNTIELDKNVKSIKSRHKEESDNTKNNDKETTTATQKRKHKHSKTKINKKDKIESIVADNLTSQNQDKNDNITKHHHNDQQKRSKKIDKMDKDITKKKKHLGNDSYNNNTSSLESNHYTTYKRFIVGYNNNNTDPLMNLEAFLGSDDDNYDDNVDEDDTAKKNKQTTKSKNLKSNRAQPKFQYKSSTRNADVMYSDDESFDDSESDSDSTNHSQKNVSNTTNVNISSRQTPSNNTVIQKSSSSASALSPNRSKDETVMIQIQTFNSSDEREFQNIHHGNNGDKKDVDYVNDDDGDDKDEGNSCQSSLGAVVGIVEPSDIDDENKTKFTKATSNLNPTDDKKDVDDSIDDSCTNIIESSHIEDIHDADDGNSKSDCTGPSIVGDREDLNSILSSASEENSTSDDAGDDINVIDHGSSNNHRIELADHSSIAEENDIIHDDVDDINYVDHGNNRHNITEPSLTTENHSNVGPTQINYNGSTIGKNCEDIKDENKSIYHDDEVDKTIVSPIIASTRFDDDDSDSDNDDYIMPTNMKMHNLLVNDEEDEDNDDEVDDTIISPNNAPTHVEDDGSDSDNDDYIIPTNKKIHKSLVNDEEEEDDNDECFIIQSTNSNITTQRTMATTTSTSKNDMYENEDDNDDTNESTKPIVMTKKEENKNELKVESNTSSTISNQVLASIAAAQKEAELMLQNAMQQNSKSSTKRVKMKKEGEVIETITHNDSDEVVGDYDKGKDAETRRNKKKKKEKKSSSSKKTSSKSKRRDVEIMEGDHNDKDGIGLVLREKETKKKQMKKKEKKGDCFEYK